MSRSILHILYTRIKKSLTYYSQHVNHKHSKLKNQLIHRKFTGRQAIQVKFTIELMLHQNLDSKIAFYVNILKYHTINL
jgi:hypothetical protein